VSALVARLVFLLALVVVTGLLAALAWAERDERR
jgi:hypothetical protein